MLLNDFFKRTQNIYSYNSTYTSGTADENPELVIECFPESDFDHAEQNYETDLFSIDNDPEVVFDDDNSEISMPKIFKDGTQFSESISQNMVKFVKMGCTKKPMLQNIKMRSKFQKIVKILFHY